MTAELIHRLHFAFTITFHYLFPQLTMGLALLIVVLKSVALKTGNETWDQAARFWGHIFGINFVFGVVTGILLTGTGFSAIYPLAAERIATRFTYYHPGYFNGIFTFAMMGGIIAPFVLGHVAASSGLRIVPIAAMAGSCAVFALVLTIALGRKVSGS